MDFKEFRQTRYRSLFAKEAEKAITVLHTMYADVVKAYDEAWKEAKLSSHVRIDTKQLTLSNYHADNEDSLRRHANEIRRTLETMRAFTKNWNEFKLHMEEDDAEIKRLIDTIVFEAPTTGNLGKL